MSPDAERAMRETAPEIIRAQRDEIERLREAVKQLGEMADCCTYDTLGEICSTCRCTRRIDEQQEPK